MHRRFVHSKMATDTFTIRKALTADVDDIHRVHTAAIQKKCSSHYSENEVEIWVERQNRAQYIPFIQDGQITVAQNLENNRVVGFGHVVPDTLLNQGDKRKSSQCAVQIKGLFVDPDCSCKGVGTSLLNHLEQIAVEQGADTLTVHSSLNAVEFYRKCGFVPLGLIAHEVSEQACLQCMKMIKTL